MVSPSVVSWAADTPSSASLLCCKMPSWRHPLTLLSRNCPPVIELTYSETRVTAHLRKQAARLVWISTGLSMHWTQGRNGSRE